MTSTWYNALQQFKVLISLSLVCVCVFVSQKKKKGMEISLLDTYKTI